MLSPITATISIIAGFLLARYLKIKFLAKFVKIFIIFIGLPLLIFHSISTAKIPLNFWLPLLICLALTLNMVASELGNHLLRLKSKGAYILQNSFSNAGFLGIPLCYLIFGNLGLAPASLFCLVQCLFHYTCGIFGSVASRFGKFSGIKGAVKFPGFWAIVAVFLLINLPIPSEFLKWIGLVGKVTLFLALFYIGLILKIPKVAKKWLMPLSHIGLYRFAISPLIIYSLSLVMEIKSPVLILQAAMPPSITNTMIAGYYKLDEKLCSFTTTFLTLIFLFITIPYIFFL